MYVCVYQHDPILDKWMRISLSTKMQVTCIGKQCKRVPELLLKDASHMKSITKNL